MVFEKTKGKIRRARQTARAIKNSPIEREAFKQEVKKRVKRGAVKGVQSSFGFVDDIFENKGGRKRKKKAFGKIKDKGLIEGGFF